MHTQFYLWLPSLKPESAFTCLCRTYAMSLYCGRQISYLLETMSAQGGGHRRMQPTQTYVIESSKLSHRTGSVVISGPRALPGSRIRNPQLA
jgi:hypothetical protein